MYYFVYLCYFADLYTIIYQYNSITSKYSCIMWLSTRPYSADLGCAFSFVNTCF